MLHHIYYLKNTEMDHLHFQIPEKPQMSHFHPNLQRNTPHYYRGLIHYNFDPSVLKKQYEVFHYHQE